MPTNHQRRVKPSEYLTEREAAFDKSFNCGHEPEECNELCMAYSKSFMRDTALSYANVVLDETIQELEKMKETQEYDYMVCAKCEKFIRNRFSHHSEDGYSECCGKKLKRLQGKENTYSGYNRGIDDAIKYLQGKMSPSSNPS